MTNTTLQRTREGKFVWECYAVMTLVTEVWEGAVETPTYLVLNFLLWRSVRKWHILAIMSQALIVQLENHNTAFLYRLNKRFVSSSPCLYALKSKSTPTRWVKLLLVYSECKVCIKSIKADAMQPCFGSKNDPGMIWAGSCLTIQRMCPLSVSAALPQQADRGRYCRPL